MKLNLLEYEMLCLRLWNVMSKNMKSNVKEYKILCPRMWILMSKNIKSNVQEYEFLTVIKNMKCYKEYEM